MYRLLKLVLPNKWRQIWVWWQEWVNIHTVKYTKYSMKQNTPLVSLDGFQVSRIHPALIRQSSRHIPPADDAVVLCILVPVVQSLGSTHSPPDLDHLQISAVEIRDSQIHCVVDGIHIHPPLTLPGTNSESFSIFKVMCVPSSS